MKCVHQAVLDSSLPNHRKLRKFSRALGMSKAEALGRLAFVWLWVAECCPDGVIPPAFDALDVADAAEFPGSPEGFVEALVESGFLECAEDGSLYVHDWVEYSGRQIARRAHERERKAAYRTKRKP